VAPRKPEVPWPAELALTDRLRAYAVQCELDADWEWGKFKNHAMQGDRRHVNWDAAWRYWCRNAVDINARRRPA
jgi:hypothetical protein